MGGFRKASDNPKIPNWKGAESSKDIDKRWMLTIAYRFVSKSYKLASGEIPHLRIKEYESEGISSHYRKPGFVIFPGSVQITLRGILPKGRE